MPVAILSRFKRLLKPKTAAKQDKGLLPIDHKENQAVQPSLPPQSSASESSRGSNPEGSVSHLGRRSRSLWQEAFEKLDDVQRDSLSKIENPQGFNVVQSVADETKKRYRESQKAGWKISGGKDKSDINLRAAAKKILSSVLWSKQLIGAGVAFDPTGYSASAWTIISLGLQIAKNDVDRLQALFEASGTLTDTLTRCAAIEASYRDKDLPDSDHLENTLVDVYVAILEFSAEIVKQNRMNIGRRVLKSISSLAEQPLQDFNKKLNSKEKDLRRWTKVIEHQYRKLEMKETDEKMTAILNGTEELTQGLSSIKSTILSAEEHTILIWLSEYDFSASHRSATLQREPGTGAWILDNIQYGEWRSSYCKLLWLYGSSGSGKTILCSRIIEDLQQLCAGDPSYALAYWYFTFSSQSSLDMDNLLCSIIRQLCAKIEALPENIRELWRVNYAAGSRPTTAILIEVLNSLIVVLKTANQNALVVLDALDEYPRLRGQAFSDVQQTSGRKDVLLWLRRFCAKHENAHVIVLSRDENDIRHALDDTSKVDIAASIVEDLHLYIPSCIERIIEEYDWKAEYRAAMFSRIEGVSEKRFRWASLMQRRFSDCLDDETMRQCLETLPESLEAMYADVLMRQIPKNYREKAHLMLMWLTYSLRPLKLRELASVASLREPMDVFRICTSSLVTWSRESVRSSERSVETTWYTHSKRDSEEDIIVKFDHFSVKEYMMSERLLASSADAASYFYVPPLLAHLSIARLSVSHLLDTNASYFTQADVCVERRVECYYYDEAEEMYEEVHTDLKGDIGVPLWPKFPLLEYSTFWYRHIWEADAIDARPAPVDITKLKSIDLKSEAQSTLYQSNNSRTQIHKLFCDAFSQSFKNWVLLLELFTNKIPYVPSEVPSPIWLASLLNLPDSVQRLLQSEMTFGGTIDFVRFSERQPDYERTPIQIAAIYGNLEVLNLVLKTDMRVEQSELAYLVSRLRRHGGAVLSAILEARPQLTITEHIVELAVWTPAQKDVYMYILNSPGVVNLSKAMFEFIVKHLRRGSDTFAIDAGVVETILRRGVDIGYSRGEMIEASIQGEGSRRNSNLVSDRYTAPSISHSILALMVANEVCGTDMLAVVLEHYKDVKISQDLLALIVARSRFGTGADMLAIALEHRKGIHISQDLLVTVSKLSKGKLFNLILEYDENIDISEDVVKAAVRNNLGGADIFSVIFSHNKKIEVSEDTLIAAAENEVSGAGIISAILSHKKEIEISENMLQAAARNHGTAASIFSAILDHNKNIDFSEGTLKLAASNEIKGVEIFLTVLNHKKHIEVSEDTLRVAARNRSQGEDIVLAILSLNKNIKVSEDLLQFAARNGSRGANIFWAIVSHNKNIIISKEVMNVIEKDYVPGRHILDMLMDHSNCEIEVPSNLESLEQMMSSRRSMNRHIGECEFRVSWKTMEAILGWEPDGITFLRAHKRSNVTFARETTQAISSNPSP